MKYANHFVNGLFCLLSEILLSCQPQIIDSNIRQVTLLASDWQFANEYVEVVSHNRAILGAFDRNNDITEVQILEDGDEYF